MISDELIYLRLSFRILSILGSSFIIISILRGWLLFLFLIQFFKNKKNSKEIL